MRFRIFLAIFGLVSLTAFPAVANSTPGQCMYSPWGGFCDSYGWQDGSFQHCESALGFSNCYQACIGGDGRPYPTDVNPATPC